MKPKMIRGWGCGCLTVGTVFFLVGGICFFTASADGLRWLAQASLKDRVSAEKSDWGRWTGSVWGKGLEVQDLALRDVVVWPQPNELKIKRMIIQYSLSHWPWPDVEMDQVRWSLPWSETVQGGLSLINGRLEASFFTPRFVIEDIRAISGQDLDEVGEGFLTDVDVTVSGPWKQLRITGQAIIGELKNGRGRLKNIRVAFDLQQSRTRFLSALPVIGRVRLEGGDVEIGPVKLQLNRGKLEFSPLEREPYFEVAASSRVQGVNISVQGQGTKSRPQWDLSSQPAFRKDQILLMLVTGKKPRSTQEAGLKTENENWLNDMVDMLFLSKAVATAASHLGLSGMNLIWGESEKGVILEKRLHPAVQVGVGITQAETESAPKPGLRQKIQAEIDLTPSLSVSAEKELVPETTESSTETVPEDKVLFKFKTQF